MNDSVYDIKQTYIDLKKDVQRNLLNIKINFFKVSKSIADKVSDYLNNKLIKYDAPNVISNNNLSLDEILASSTVELNEDYLNNNSILNSAQKNTVLQTPKLSYFIPSQYKKAIETISINEAENEMADILLGNKKNMRWSERINLLRSNTKKYDSDIIDKYKSAIMKNKYLRYSKKQEYKDVLDILENTKV